MREERSVRGQFEQPRPEAPGAVRLVMGDESPVLHEVEQAVKARLRDAAGDADRAGGGRLCAAAQVLQYVERPIGRLRRDAPAPRALLVLAIVHDRPAFDVDLASPAPTTSGTVRRSYRAPRKVAARERGRSRLTCESDGGLHCVAASARAVFEKMPHGPRVLSRCRGDPGRQRSSPSLGRDVTNGRFGAHNARDLVLGESSARFDVALQGLEAGDHPAHAREQHGERREAGRARDLRRYRQVRAQLGVVPRHRRGAQGPG